MKWIWGFMLVVCIALLGAGLYFFWQISTETSFEEFSAPQAVQPQMTAAEGKQFYPNMRYPDRNISYRLESFCTLAKFEDIERAFQILGQKTMLTFYSTRENPEIEVFCSGVPQEENAMKKGYFIAGEGGPTEVINASAYSVILRGKIALYKDEKCDEPKVALHEILHALGFDHLNNTGSIMNPISECNQQIDVYIINEINKLYSIGSAPDLLIERASGDKKGRYLNFNITIANYGLKIARDVNLEVYADSSKVSNFSMENLDVGTKKTLSVGNLAVPIETAKIGFVVYSPIDNKELNIENNRAEIEAVNK